MLKLSNFFHRTTVMASPEPIDETGLPTPDVSHNPQLIAAAIHQLCLQDASLTDLLIEGEIAPRHLRKIVGRPESGRIYIELNELAADWVGKKLTLISTYHESRIAFSVTILTHCNLNGFELAWPDEMIQISSRQYYRFHPQHPIDVRLQSGTERVVATLYDISEGGLGLLISTQEYPKLQAICQQALTIGIASLLIKVQLQLSNQVPSRDDQYLRLGLALHSQSENDLAKLRRFLMQLQAKH